MADKPIRIFYNPMTGRFWASAHYRDNGKTVVITGAKFDVTNEIGAAITHYQIEFTEDRSSSTNNPSEVA